MTDQLQQIERDRHRGAARAKKAQAVASYLISHLDQLGYDLAAELHRLQGASPGEWDVIAAQAGQRPPSRETWDLVMSIVAAVAKDRERNPDPFGGLAA